MNNQIIEINGIKMVDKDGELYFVKEGGNLVKFLELENYKDYIMNAIEYYKEQLEGFKYGEMNVFKAIIDKLKTDKEYRSKFIKCLLLFIACPLLFLPISKGSILGLEQTTYMFLFIELVITGLLANELTNDIFMERKGTKVYKKNIEFLKKRLKELEIELSKNDNLLLERVPETIITELRRFEEFDPYAGVESFEPSEDDNTLRRVL